MKPISDARTCKDRCTYLQRQMLNECSVLNKLTLLTYQYETKQEEG